MSSAIPSPPPPTFGIHGNQSYIDFEFSFFTLPMLLLLLPILYMPITLIIILRILVKLIYAIKEKNVNVHLFFAITFSQFTCLLFFVFDWFHLRLPATGIFTSWCASVEPNRFLNLLYFLTFYVNYATMLFPFLVSIMRLILIICPQNHGKVNGTLLRIAIPFILIYPAFFTFFMIPSLGYCFQPGPPYQFGQIQIMFRGTWFGLRNNYFLLGNTMFWMSACFINNLVLLVKLVRLKLSLSAHIRSQRSFKAEVSLTLTTLSMIFSYVTNGLIVISFLAFPSYTYTAIMMRPFGNDLETCVVPWVFYLTHPISMNNVSIQGDPRYINYEFDFFTFPVLIACIPLIYLVPTTCLIFKILSVYCRMLVTKREESLNPNVFFVIVLAQLASVCYMLSDYFTIRLPSTGLMTSWCASQHPNHFLKLLFFFSVYFNYTAMLFPFLLSVLRLIPIYYPGRHNQLSARIVYFSTPLIFLYPFLFSFFLIPAVGFCRQLLGPYQFGAIYIFFSGAWHDMKLANFLFFNVIFWLIACVVTNITLYVKLKKLRNKRKSKRLQRAELSLTLTSFSMLISYVTNLIFIIMFIIYPPLSTYFIALRPFGNDCDTVFVPWIFYLTHPAFKRTQRGRVETTKHGTVHTTI